MANIKFSQFVAETDVNNFTDIVGYAGVNNTRITPADLASSLITLQGGPFLPLTAGATKPLTGDLNLAATGAGPSVGSQAVVFNGVDDTTSAVIAAKIFTLDSTINPSGQDLYIQNADDAGVLGTNIYVSAFGFVGLGTTSPAANLDIANDLVVGTSVTFSDYGSGTKTGTATQALAVTATGSVIEIPVASGGSSAYTSKAGGATIDWDFATDGPNIIVTLASASANQIQVSALGEFPDGTEGNVILIPTSSSNYKMPDEDFGSAAGINSLFSSGNTSLGGTNKVLFSYTYDDGTFYWKKFENYVDPIYPPDIQFPLTDLVAYYTPEAFNQAVAGTVSSGALVEQLTSSNTIGDLQTSASTTNFDFSPKTATDPAYWSIKGAATAILRGSALTSGVTTQSTLCMWMQGPYVSKTFGGIFDFFGTQAGAAFDQGFYLSNLSFLLFSPNYIFGYPSLIDYSATGGADLTSEWMFVALQFFPSTTTGSNDGSVKIGVGCASSEAWAVANPPAVPGGTTNWDYENGDGTGNTVPVDANGIYFEQSGSTLDIDEFFFENVYLGNASNLAENNPANYGEFAIFNNTIPESQIVACWNGSKATYGI